MFLRCASLEEELSKMWEKVKIMNENGCLFQRVKSRGALRGGSIKNIQVVMFFFAYKFLFETNFNYSMLKDGMPKFPVHIVRFCCIHILFHILILVYVMYFQFYHLYNTNYVL